MSNRTDRDVPPAHPANLLQFLDVADNVFVTLDTLGRVSLLNRHGCELLGYEEQEVLGKSWFEHFLPDHVREEVREAFDVMMSGQPGSGGRAECPVLCRDGSERVIAWHNTVLRQRDGVPMGTLSSGTDITEQWRARRELRASRKEVEDIKHALDKASIVAITDVSGRIFYVNDRFCETSGYSRNELIGQDHRLLNSGHHPRSFMKELWTTITAGRVWRGEIRNRARNGRLYWVDTTIVPFLDESGRPYQYMAIRNEITDRKRSEEQLREQAALTRLGEMASVVAHEVRNPLAGIGGALQVIARRIPEDRAEHRVIQDILARIETLNAKMEDLLQYARPKTPELRRLDLAELARGVLEQVEQDPRFEGITIALRGDAVQCEADAGLLSAALLNLLLNAAEATGAGGRVTLTIGHDNGQCVISVSDDGPGIPRKVYSRVFEPFFTTRHKGTGLGLAIVKRAVEGHGGHIAIESPPGGGATLRIFLPISPT